jgi:acetylornithine deacetylase/succinyl-diaminopimelate desuccinylase-like protein
VFAFLADEEAGGNYGAQWLVAHRPELFDGCSEAIGEVGGFSLTLADDLRLYPIETGEKGMAWIRLRARGRPGHGSFIHTDNAVTAIAEAVAKLGNHRFPLVLTDTVTAFLDTLTELTGIEFPLDDLEGSLAKLGTISRLIGATVRDTANPTMLTAGYKSNVIPERAEARIDIRPLPGQEDALLAQLDELVGENVRIELVVKDTGLENPTRGELVSAIGATIERHDPGVPVLPYLMPAGTDNKALSLLGIRGYGFAPLRLSAELDFPALFHGIDERVPLDALGFGRAVLADLLASY